MSKTGQMFYDEQVKQEEDRHEANCRKENFVFLVKHKQTKLLKEKSTLETLSYRLENAFNKIIRKAL